jgi:hypothetical protein
MTYDTLLLLLAKLPPADLTVFVGDMVDRGPRSVDVLNLVRSGATPQGGLLRAILGNHEFMMLDPSDRWLWYANGGMPTSESLGELSKDECASLLNWVEGLPIYIEIDDLLITHAPIQCRKWDWKQVEEGDNVAFTWPRDEPKEAIVCSVTGKKFFNVFGHNGKHRLYLDESSQPFACCIDDSHNYKMAAFCWPSMKVISIDQVEKGAPNGKKS